MTTNAKFRQDKAGLAVHLLGFVSGGTHVIDIGAADNRSTNLVPAGSSHAFYTLKAQGDCYFNFGADNTVVAAAGDPVMLDGDVYDVVVSANKPFLATKQYGASTGKLFVMRRE